MKTKQSLVCGFLAVMLALAFGACSAAKGQKLTGTDSFKFTVIDNGTAYSVSAGTATEGTVNIPAYYRPNADSDYLPVTAIGSFRGCRNIIKITIPASVMSIGSSAFWDCRNLTNINIPKGVTSIGKGAFFQCISFTSITIPAGVTSISDSAFSCCTNLTSITIPTNVTSIGKHAFSGCTSLASVTIPASVTSIGSNAFSGCTNLTSIIIPIGVTSIGYDAFALWTASQTINIEGHASQAAADTMWGADWRKECNANINYLGQ